MQDNRYCVILAGGQSMSFWPISRQSQPKAILNYPYLGKTLIRQTYERYTALVPQENIFFVTSSEFKQLLNEQVPELTDSQILIEPYGKNTSPCIAFAAYTLLQKDPDALMLVSPADHLIREEEVFVQAMGEAFDYTEKNDILMTIGVKPSKVNTNYGYIQVANGNDKYLKVKTFTEKPSMELAQIFCDSGEFYWNTGIYIWQAKSIIKEFEHYIPEIPSLFNGWENNLGGPNERSFLEEAYSDCPNISIDYGVMEKTSKAYLYPAQFTWADIGSWDNLWSNMPDLDENANAICVENSIVEDCKNSFFDSSNRQKLIVAKGLDGFILIDTPDALLIYPKGSNLRELVSSLNKVELNKYK